MKIIGLLLIFTFLIFYIIKKRKKVGLNNKLNPGNDSSNINQTTIKHYEKIFGENGLLSKWLFFEKHLKPEISIELTRLTEDNIKIGQSKIGGHPDLPQDTNWPKENNGKDFLFLAQINLQELTNNEIKYIPKNGIIYFFYSEDYKGGKTLFVEKTSSLERKEAPKTIKISNSWFNSNRNSNVYHSCYLKFNNTYSLPDSQYEFVSQQLNEREKIKYQEITATNAFSTKLFGHSDCIQYPMEHSLEVADKSHVFTNDIISNEKIKQEIKKNQYQWKLLFQIDSEKESKMMWGDVGRLYFWIKEKDLKAQNFDKVITVLQCC